MLHRCSSSFQVKVGHGSDGCVCGAFLLSCKLTSMVKLHRNESPAARSSVSTLKVIRNQKAKPVPNFIQVRHCCRSPNFSRIPQKRKNPQLILDGYCVWSTGLSLFSNFNYCNTSPLLFHIHISIWADHFGRLRLSCLRSGFNPLVC